MNIKNYVALPKTSVRRISRKISCWDRKINPLISTLPARKLVLRTTNLTQARMKSYKGRAQA